MQLHEEQGVNDLVFAFITSILSRCLNVCLTSSTGPSTYFQGSQRGWPPCGTLSICSPLQAGCALCFLWLLFLFSSRYLSVLDQSLGWKQTETILFSFHLGTDVHFRTLNFQSLFYQHISLHCSWKVRFIFLRIFL